MTLLVQDRAGVAVAQPERAVGQGIDWRLPRRPLIVALAGAATLPILGLGGLWSSVALVLLGGLIATALATDHRGARSSFGVIEWLPAAFLLGVFAVTALGLFAGLVHVPIWGSRTAALLTWSLLITVPVLVGLRRGGAVRLARNGVGPLIFTLTVLMPALALLAVPFERWARLVTLGSDFPRHVMLVWRTVGEGLLDYSVDSYPRSAHAAIALVQAASGDTSLTGTWQATEGVLISMFGLLALGAAMIARQVGQALRAPQWLSRGVAPGAVVVLLLAGIWGTAMLPDGYLTSFQAGLIIVAAASLAWHGDLNGSQVPILVALALSALMAHTWLILLPLVAVPTAWLALQALRQRSGRAEILTGGLLSILVASPVVISTARSLGIDALGTPGGTELPVPGIRWLILLATVCFAIAVLLRSRAPQPATFYALMVMSLVGVLAFVLLHSGAGQLGSYYFVKTALTPLGWLLAVAVPTVLWAAWRATVTARAKCTRRWLGTGAAAATVAAAAAVLALIGHAAGPLTVARALTGDMGQPAVFIPLVEQVRNHFDNRPGDAVVWGLSPYLDPSAGSLDASSRLDYIAQGTLLVAGYGTQDLSLGAALLRHDPRMLCSFLEQHPDALIITGPHAEGPQAWLLDSGCPAAVVRPTQWLSIELEPSWFDGTPHEGMPYGSPYAGWNQLRDLVRQDRTDPAAVPAAS